RIRVMVERSRSRVTAEPALLDSGKLDVQIPEYAMIVEKYGARFDSIGHRFGPLTILRPHRGAKPIWRVVCALDRIILTGERHDRNHRSELLAHDNIIVVICAEHDRRQQEKSCVPARSRKLSSFGHHRETPATALIEKTIHEVELRSVVERTHRRFRRQPVANHDSIK